MLKCVILFIYGILSVTAYPEGLAIPVPREYRSDNSAQETAIEAYNKNNDEDTEILDNVDNDIDNTNKLKSDGQRTNIEKFTDFIQVVIEILNRYDDTDLEHFFYVFNDEVRKYHYNGCKFNELTDNEPFKRYMASKFDEVKEMSAADIRIKISKIADQIEDARQSRHEKALIDFVNSLYKQDSIEKFNKFLVKIDDYKRNVKDDIDLVKIVREGVRSIIFNHYTKLDYNTRAALKAKLDIYWDHIKPTISLRSFVNPKDVQLLHNIPEDGKFYFPNKDQQTSQTLIPKKYQTRTLDKRKLTFMTLYPKLVLDWHIMSSTTSVPLEYTTPKTKLEKNFNIKKKKHKHEFNQESTLRKSRYVTNNVLRLINEMSIQEDNDHLITEAIDKETAGSAAFTFMDYTPAVSEEYNVRPTPKLIKHMKRDTEDDLQIIKKSLARTPKVSQKKFKSRKKTTESLRTTKQTQQHKPFIEIVTKRPYVRDRIGGKKIRYDINLRNIKARSNIRPQQLKDTSTEVTQAPFNEDSDIAKEGLSIEELKEDGTAHYRRNYNKDIPEGSVLIDKNVLIRLHELENELNDVKTLVNNDTEIIKDLKSHLPLNDKDTSREYVLAKVIPCTDKQGTVDVEDIEVNQQTYSDNRKRVRHSYDGDNKDVLEDLTNRHNVDTDVDRTSFDDVKHKDTSIEDTIHNFDTVNAIRNAREGKYKSDDERQVIPDLNRLEYNRNDNKVTDINSNEVNDIDVSTVHSRRAMINKVEEIKQKLDTAIKSNEKYRRKGSSNAEANIDFEKEYIPKDTFDSNMKKLAKYLGGKKDSRKVVLENKFDKYKETLKEANKRLNDIEKSLYETEKKINSDTLTNNFTAEVLNYGDKDISSKETDNIPNWDIILKNNNQNEHNFDTDILNHKEKIKQYELNSPNKDSIHIDAKHIFRRSINFDKDILNNDNLTYAVVSPNSNDKINKPNKDMKIKYTTQKYITDTLHKHSSNKNNPNLMTLHRSSVDTNNVIRNNKTNIDFKLSKPNIPKKPGLHFDNHKKKATKYISPTKDNVTAKKTKPNINSNASPKHLQKQYSFTENNNSQRRKDDEISSSTKYHDNRRKASNEDNKDHLNKDVTQHLSQMKSTASHRLPVKISTLTSLEPLASKLYDDDAEDATEAPFNKESKTSVGITHYIAKKITQKNIDELTRRNLKTRKGRAPYAPTKYIPDNADTESPRDMDIVSMLKETPTNYKEDFLLNQKDYLIDWDKIDIPKMLEEATTNSQISSTAGRRLYAFPPTSPNTRKTEVTVRDIYTTPIPTTTEEIVPTYIPLDMFHSFDDNEPLDENFLRYNMNSPFKEDNRRDNTLHRVPPAKNHKIKLNSEEEFNIKIKSRLKVAKSLNNTQTTVDIDSLINKIGPLPHPVHMIQEAIVKPVESINPLRSGRRSMNAEVLGPEDDVKEDLFQDPFVSDIEDAFATKLTSINTSRGVLDD